MSIYGIANYKNVTFTNHKTLFYRNSTDANDWNFYHIGRESETYVRNYATSSNCGKIIIAEYCVAGAHYGSSSYQGVATYNLTVDVYGINYL